MKTLETAQKYWNKFSGKLLASIFILPFIMWIWPNAVPFNFFEFWHIKGSAYDWLYSAWPFLLYGPGLALIVVICTRNDRLTNLYAEDIIKEGTWVSLLAGIGEEICFRWLFFLWGIVAVTVTNFFFFGFLGFGIPEFFYTYVFGPVADWMTLGFLEPYLYHYAGWAVGAGMLSANAFFRDGHKYQGPFGWISSWFAGMYLFWFMFTYGLLAAIILHFLYDFLIYLVRYIDAVIERARGY